MNALERLMSECEACDNCGKIRLSENGIRAHYPDGQKFLCSKNCANAYWRNHVTQLDLPLFFSPSSNTGVKISLTAKKGGR